MKWNRIINGDCLDVMKKFPKDSVDLTVFSPPYDNLRAYDGEWKMDLSRMGKVLYQKTVDGGVCVIVMGDTANKFAMTLTTYRTILDWCDNAGWKLFTAIIYHRDGTPGPWYDKRFRVDHEYMLVFFKGNKPRHFDKTDLAIRAKYVGTRIHGRGARTASGNFDGSVSGKKQQATKCRGTVWFYSTGKDSHNKWKSKHPAVYPDALAKDLISCFSKETDRILDPMCGSGTTCVMAAKMNRKYIGIDISEKYTKIAKKRIKNEASIEEIMYRKSGSKWSVSPLDGE